MGKQQLRILLVNTLDQEGGAEQVAWSLLEGYLARNHQAWLAVGVKKSTHPNVLLFDNANTANRWARRLWRVHANATRLHGATRWGEKARRVSALLAAPRGILEALRGHEHSHYPGTYSLPDLPPYRPDILHCHSLQRGYFELEALPALSRQTPTILTLHDAWLLSGHCTHPFGCERWKKGCGACPDLTIPPAVLRDGTARNWQRKQAIFAQSRVWIAADSQWLLNKVRASMLSYLEARVIYPGIDLTVFRRADRQAARSLLGLPSDAKILLFVAHRARRNPWKDYALLQQMMRRIRGRLDTAVILLVVGDPVAETMSADGEVWLAPPVATAAQLAHYYCAADIYVHATHVETFGLTIVEAMASGLPVVATNTAAIPELVTHAESGFLTVPGDVEEMATRVIQLLENSEQRQSMGRRAERASKRFDVNITIKTYLDWYKEILTMGEETQPSI